MAKDSPYFDDDNEPVLHDSAVLFLDLLGTRGIRSNDQAQAQLRATRAAVMKAQKEVADSQGEAGAARWFSDNLGLSYPIGGAWDPSMALGFLCLETAYMQMELALDGFMSRGAIARGLYFTDETFIHGPALERAVELEKTRAVFPRVVLDEAAVALATAALHVEDPGHDSPWRSQLIVDEDGVVFVSYIDALFDDIDDLDLVGPPLATHCKVVQQRLFEFDGVPAIHDKYRWLAGYHNSMLELHAPALESVGIAAKELEVTCSRPLGQFEPFGHDFPPPPEEPVLGQ